MMDEQSLRRLLHSVEPPELRLPPPGVDHYYASSGAGRRWRTVGLSAAAIALVAFLGPAAAYLSLRDGSPSPLDGERGLETCGTVPSMTGPHSDDVMAKLGVSKAGVHSGDVVSVTIKISNIADMPVDVMTGLPGDAVIVSSSGKVVGKSDAPLAGVGGQFSLRPGESAEVPATILLAGCPSTQRGDASTIAEGQRLPLPAGTYYLVGLVSDLSTDGSANGLLVSDRVAIQVLPPR